MLLMWKEIMEQPSAIERNFASNSPKIDQILEEISNRNIHCVYTAARGTSNHAAFYGKYALEMTVGIPVSLGAPSITTIYGKKVNFENCLVIAISQSGKAADALEVIKEANRQGALTISITNYPDSPLALEAKYHLCCEAEPELSVAATKTFTSQMFPFALLAAKWAKDNELIQELKKIPEKLTETFKLADIIENRVERYRFMNECFVLSRGANYPIALESALKIQETTYVRAKAFPTSEFYHGPIAMLDREIPAILYAPEGPSFKNLQEMALKLKDKEVETVVVSNNAEMLSMGTTAFRIPETSNDLISPFLCAAVAQMFACKLSLAKGLNPDSPRSLSKVTITL
ncbi:MAG TPA: SIS domain-containing protein [Clostridiaceae bacterium]|nr:SIS domain-containing protein [Clostridiaceae bacterium]